jgi:hypothetical protein
VRDFTNPWQESCNLVVLGRKWDFISTDFAGNWIRVTVMDTILTIMGGLVLICSLAYFHSQDSPRRQDRLFESAESMLPLETEAEDSLGLPVVTEGAGRPVEG